jgi:Protein of unknown function (DUF2846)
MTQGRVFNRFEGNEPMTKMIFIVLLFIVFFVTCPVLAQTGNAGTPGCGAPNAKFAVNTEKGQPHPAQPDAGKALVYFIEDDSEFESSPKPTTRIGVDGEWVGATHGNSYFHASIAPGVHHLCASWQTTVLLGQGHKAAAAHFTAEAGGVYYFSVKNEWLREHGTASVSLTPLDSDEGQLLADKLSFSTSQPKK